MPSKPPTPNPYCGFKDDKERRLALRSRDVRLVLMALISSGGGIALLKSIGDWIGR